MSVREEFEKALKNWVNITCLKQMSVGPDEAALWAAKWMAERCAEEVENWEAPISISFAEAEQTRNRNALIAMDVRQLAKDLETP